VADRITPEENEAAQRIAGVVVAAFRGDHAGVQVLVDTFADDERLFYVGALHLAKGFVLLLADRRKQTPSRVLVDVGRAIEDTRLTAIQDDDLHGPSQHWEDAERAAMLLAADLEGSESPRVPFTEFGDADRAANAHVLLLQSLAMEVYRDTGHDPAELVSLIAMGLA
jgi:hypothetical protein